MRMCGLFVWDFEVRSRGGVLSLWVQCGFVDCGFEDFTQKSCSRHRTQEPVKILLKVLPVFALDLTEGASQELVTFPRFGFQELSHQTSLPRTSAF